VFVLVEQSAEAIASGGCEVVRFGVQMSSASYQGIRFDHGCQGSSQRDALGGT
jgi:hypothetical protein